MQEVIKYVADDGTEFEDEADCFDYERKMLFADFFNRGLKTFDSNKQELSIEDYTKVDSLLDDSWFIIIPNAIIGLAILLVDSRWEAANSTFSAAFCFNGRNNSRDRFSVQPGLLRGIRFVICSSTDIVNDGVSLIIGIYQVRYLRYGLLFPFITQCIFYSVQHIHHFILWGKAIGKCDGDSQNK